MEELDLKFVDQTVDRVGTGAEKVLEILQALQTHYGYLPTEALQRVCELTEIAPATITGVSTFYDQFRHRPAGRHIIHVCVGTACHVKGADQVYDEFLRYLSIPDGEDTDAQKLFTVEKIACLGCCTLAPAVQIDDVTYGHLTRETVPKVLNDFLKHADARAAHHRKRRRRWKAGAVGELRVDAVEFGRHHRAVALEGQELGVGQELKRAGLSFGRLGVGDRILQGLDERHLAAGHQVLDHADAAVVLALSRLDVAGFGVGRATQTAANRRLLGPFVDGGAGVGLGQLVEQSEVLVLLNGGHHGFFQRLDAQGTTAGQRRDVGAVTGLERLAQLGDIAERHLAGHDLPAGGSLEHLRVEHCCFSS